MTRSAPIPVPERTTSAEQAFTTEGLDGDPWEYWSDVTRAAFVAMRPAALPDTPAPEGFDATTVARRMGALRLSTVRADPHEAARTPALVRQAEAEDFFLTLVTEGSGILAQNERTAALGPGDFALLDSTKPFIFRFGERFRTVVLQIPRGMLVSRCSVAEWVTAVPFRAAGGLGAFVAPVVIRGQFRRPSRHRM
jgi:hypothetical protein